MNSTSATRRRDGQKSGVKPGISSRPQMYFPAQMRARLGPLHRALKAAIPELGGDQPLSSKLMDIEFRKAVKAKDPRDAKLHYLQANLLKRWNDSLLSDPQDRIDAAVRTLLETEIQCRFTNQVFAGGLDLSNAHIPLHLLPVLKKARRIMSTILGRFPWELFPRACGFTPGATTEFSHKEAAPHNKWARAAHVTKRALPYAVAFSRWANIPGVPHSFKIEECNRVFTVPKNFERDRTACKPVTWNGFLQKGVGTLIRRRAQRKKGLLLPNAQEYHQVLAKVGSGTGLLTTRDLSSASDTIALALVECLLPPDWCKVLFDLREWEGLLPDQETIVTWEKLSSMGNGFTFELETVLFYSLVTACMDASSEGLVSVYGDDIIFPRQFTEKVDELLSFCGFRINLEKSFSDGPFRESCGGHYFGGVDVKPFYLTGYPTSMGDVIQLHNDIVRWCEGSVRPGSRWFETWRVCRQIVPRSFWGPCSVQGSLWCEWDDARPTYEPDYQAFKVGIVARVMSKPLDLHDPCDDEGVSSNPALVGAYLQKLWRVDPLPWESTETSTFRSTSNVERSTWVFVDRAQWKRLSAETLCS